MSRPISRRRWLVGAVVAGAAVVGALLAAPHAVAEGGGSESATVMTPRGVELVADLHVPERPNGTAVVIAPGQGYHRGLPLVARSAEALAARGFTALRFDWGYFTAGGERSADGAVELEDLEAAIAHVRRREGVERVLLVGKSLGSMLAVERAAARSDDLAGVALLTFPIHNPGATEQLFFEPATLDRIAAPMLVICGDRDPICELAPLYRLLGATARPARVVIAPGDHSLRPADKDEARSAENADLAVRALVLWAERFAASAPEPAAKDD